MRHQLPVALVLALLLPSTALAAGEAAKPKKPIATVQPEPSVHVEGGDVLTVAPIQGEGLANHFPISAARAYQVLRDEARDIRPNAKLYSLDTGMYALSADGTASGWVAEFLSDTPGELVTVLYSEGKIEGPYIGSVSPDRPGVPEPDLVGYDIKKLYQETMQYATGVVDPITRVTASLYRSVGSGKALWLLDVYGDDDRIGQTVVFEARTMKFSHKTK